jgi:hypothetical protein|nr:MAG TPA: Flagellar and Swarming motility protein [Caudoviricetes sp.]
MFIIVTFKNDVMYINVEHIEMFKNRVDYTQIWLGNGYTVAVNETSEEILKLIEEARNHGNQG